jgi:hypothetical protein
LGSGILGESVCTRDEDAGELYTKLNPHRGYHRDLLQEFLERLWGFYDRLNKYREKPDEKEKEKLEEAFDTLFFDEDRI